MKIYITRWALTKGVIECDGIRRSEEGGDYVRVPAFQFTLFRLGKDAFTSRDDAIADAEKRRLRKLESIRRSLRNIEGMTFE